MTERNEVALTALSAYQQFIIDNPIVILKASAVWCGPCKVIKPLFDSEVLKLPIDVSIIHLDINQGPSIARKLSIRAVPCMISIIGGYPVDVVTGANPAAVSKFFAKVQKRLLGQ